MVKVRQDYMGLCSSEYYVQAHPQQLGANQEGNCRSGEEQRQENIR